MIYKCGDLIGEVGNKFKEYGFMYNMQKDKFEYEKISISILSKYDILNGSMQLKTGDEEPLDENLKKVVGMIYISAESEYLENRIY